MTKCCALDVKMIDNKSPVYYSLLLFNIFYLRASLSDKKFTNDFTLPVRNIFL